MSIRARLCLTPLVLVPLVIPSAAHPPRLLMRSEPQNWATDPLDWLQRTFRREVVVQRYLEDLRLAGLEIEPGKPALD